MKRSILFTALLSLCVFPTFSCQAPPPDHREVNKQVAREIYAAVDAMDYDGIRALCAEDAVFRVDGMDEDYSPESLVEMIQMFHAGFPDYVHVIDVLVAEGDWVAVKLTFHATHEGEFQGVPATGNAVTYGGAHFGRIVDGLIREWWILENDLSLMQQMGMELGPVGAGT